MNTEVLTSEQSTLRIDPDSIGEDGQREFRCPETTGALEHLPYEVRLEWEKTFATHLNESQDEFPDRSRKEHLQYAHFRANAPFRIKEVKTLEEARGIEAWRLMRRNELPFSELPLHAQKKVRSEMGRTSGTYLELYTIDGRQYFFEVPEEKQ